MQETLPILYSFRRCPYAIRARMALAYAGIEVELREVVLRDKPEAMLAISGKGTVPVLQLAERVVDESLDVMHWALQQSDPDGWCALTPAEHDLAERLVEQCDGEFKHWLDRYKYADRHPEEEPFTYRGRAEVFLATLEQELSSGQPCLLGVRLSYADIAIFPFVRQFAFVDKGTFDALPYPRVQTWLEGMLASELFLSVMDKYPQWQEGDTPTVFGTQTTAGVQHAGA